MTNYHKIKTDKSESRRRKLLVFIHEFHELNYYCPDTREMGDAAGITSTSVTAYYLRMLKDDGLIDYKLRTARTTHLTETGRLVVNEMLKIKAVPHKKQAVLVHDISQGLITVDNRS